MEELSPVIRGIFINSHLNRVREQKGDAGIAEVERLYGKPLNFSNTENIPVKEEIKIIEAVLQVLSEKPIPPDKLSYEAGRLHFQDFSQTPLGRIVFSVFRGDFKTMMTKSQYIAEHVFKGIKFETFDLGPKMVKVVISNADYPIEHFQGLFQEWMNYSKEKGVVEAKELEPKKYEYVMHWE